MERTREAVVPLGAMMMLHELTRDWEKLREELRTAEAEATRLRNLRADLETRVNKVLEGTGARYDLDRGAVVLRVRAEVLDRPAVPGGGVVIADAQDPVGAGG